MSVRCDCAKPHDGRRIVLTGGPGAGKTAVLELIRQYFCSHVRILPEAAGIIFGGGFPRHEDVECHRAAQRAIFHVQRELELVGLAHDACIVLCDRGTLDGVAYWPGSAQEFWASVGTSLEHELERYAVVIHLRTPGERGYNHRNPLRIESAVKAAEIDARILEIWATHPRRFVVDASPDFFGKAARAMEILRNEIPECCSHHVVPVQDDSRLPLY